MPDSAHRRHFIISNAISLLPLVGFLYAGMVSLLYIAGYLLFVYWRLNTEYKYFQLFSDLKFPSALTRDLIYATALVHVLFLFSCLLSKIWVKVFHSFFIFYCLQLVLKCINLLKLYSFLLSVSKQFSYMLRSK